MAQFSHQLDRRKVFFSDHALDRWWERCKKNEINGRKEAISLLKKNLESATWTRSMPAWSRLSWWHHARAEGFVRLDNNRGFVVNRNPSRDLVAVTYIERRD